MENKEVKDAFNQLISEALVSVFNEETKTKSESNREKIERGTLTLIIEKNSHTDKWDILLNQSLITSCNSKEKAKEIYDLILYSYNQGILEGLEKGSWLGTEDYPDSLSLGIGFQEE